MKDDLVDGDEAHDEGVLDSGMGLRAGGVSWTVIPAPGIVSHGLREVFTDGHRGPFLATKYDFRAHEIERRPDGLAVPVLADVGAQLPSAAAPPAMPPRASVGDVMLPGTAA